MTRVTRARRIVAILATVSVAALAGASVARADPTVTVPGDIVAEATGPSGADVTYSASAQDGDTPLPISCTNPDGSTSDGTGTINPTVAFPLGGTTVTCSTTGAQGSFTVTVQDTTPPSVTPPAPVTAEATGPSGAAVNYGLASANDLVDGSVAVSCSPISGSTFPLGSNTVTCTATDSHGNTGSATTTVLVQDTTPPTVHAPRSITVVAPAGTNVLDSSNPEIAAFLAGATASDLVDPSPTITVSGPRLFPVGSTSNETFTATDHSGNSASATSTITVAAASGGTPPPPPPPPPPGGNPPPPPPPPPGAPPDRTPPAEASSFMVKAGDHLVTVTWKLPKDADFDHVVLTRSSTRSPQADKVVYTGRGTRYVDRKLSNGVRFRYTLATVDATGNRSDGVSATATPHTVYLVSPADQARVSAPPTLLWVPMSKATYYNVQLFRGGTKVLSAWPSNNRFRIARTWKYRGRHYRLVAGTYRWYVWPGLGKRSAVKYGRLLGQSTFVYAPG